MMKNVKIAENVLDKRRETKLDKLMSGANK